MNENHFAKWINSYPKGMHHEFHRDGIISSAVFAREKIKVLFIVKEPNSKEGNYNKYLGHDLRELWKQDVPLKKPFNYNVARWTRIVCDDVDPKDSLPWTVVGQTMRRVAIINLKKMAGSGSENREEIALYSFQDKGFIRDQISEIRPDVILTCGKDGFVFRMVWRIMNDSLFFPSNVAEIFHAKVGRKIVPVFKVYHPSLRRTHEEQASGEITAVSKRLNDILRGNERG